MSWRWLVGFLALVGVANVFVLVAQAHALIRSLYLSADNAAGLVLPALASHAPAGSVVNLGNHPWYETWWLMRATASLPGYRGLWEVAPFLFGLLGIVVVAGCSWWGLGRLAALLSAVALLATSEAERGILYVPDSHGMTIPHAGVLGGSLLLADRSYLCTGARSSLGSPRASCCWSECRSSRSLESASPTNCCSSTDWLRSCWRRCCAGRACD